ncbi:unnamed protein product, partial [Closterium sp. NIES-54]
RATTATTLSRSALSASGAASGGRGASGRRSADRGLRAEVFEAVAMRCGAAARAGGRGEGRLWQAHCRVAGETLRVAPFA